MPDDQRGWPRRRMAIVALLAAPLLTLAAGCGAQTTSSAGPLPTATNSALPIGPSATGPGDTTASAASTTTPATPTPTRPVAVPSAVAAGLAVYADTRGTMALVGPKGWSCAAAYAADGSGGVVIYPPGTPAPQSVNAVWKLGQTTPMGIYATESSACYTCTLGQACPLFPAAAKTYRDYLGHGCGTKPAAETVMSISSGIVSFEDPPGVHGDATPSGGQYSANAVMTYYPNTADGSWLETCTLPDTNKAECTAALNTFLTWYGTK